MRVCFTSDLHGAAGLYEQLGLLVKAEGVDLVVLGGDLFADVDRDRPVDAQVETMVAEFVGRIEAWRDARPELAVACIGGNHELAAFRQRFLPHHRSGRLTLLDHRKAWRFGGIEWLGYSCAPPSPHWAKDYERLDLTGDTPPDFPGVVWDDAERRLRAVGVDEHFRSKPSIEQDLAQSPRLAPPWILVAHPPPHATTLDRMPELSYPVGSRAVRRYIEERQPVLTLHGHFHDSHVVTGAYRDHLGRTLCVNPGQSRDRLHAVLFDLERPEATMRHTVLR